MFNIGITGKNVFFILIYFSAYIKKNQMEMLQYKGRTIQMSKQPKSSYQFAFSKKLVIISYKGCNYFKRTLYKKDLAKLAQLGKRQEPYNFFNDFGCKGSFFLSFFFGGEVTSPF